MPLRPVSPEGSLRRVLRPLLSVSLLTLLAGCEGTLDPKGPVARDDLTILIDATLIMLVIVVPTILLAFWMAWRYRAGNPKADYKPNWSYSGRIEAIAWSIPILTIMFLGGVIWIGSYKLDPMKPLPSKVRPLEVQVVSLDWKWLFIYPQQGVASVNRLVVPAGVPVHFSITSASVFNTFFVPQLGSMIYAMPGMVSQLNLQADQPGQFRGISGHFSGDGFSDMDFQVQSVPATQFAAWANGTRGHGPALDMGAYAGLSKQSTGVKPYDYGAIDRRLFDAISSQKIAPAPGPEPENKTHAGREVAPGGKR